MANTARSSTQSGATPKERTKLALAKIKPGPQRRPRRYTDDGDPVDPGVAAVVDALNIRAVRNLSPRNKVELADALGVSKQAVSMWHRIPVLHVLKIEQVLGVHRTIQRPDVYGPSKGITTRVRVPSSGALRAGRHQD